MIVDLQKNSTKTKNPLKLERILADRTGLEPATSAVTGRHSNQLNYRSNYPIHECLIKNQLSFIFRDGKDRGFEYFVKKVFHLFSGKEQYKLTP
jgi:hypothetical protein